MPRGSFYLGMKFFKRGLSAVVLGLGALAASGGLTGCLDDSSDDLVVRVCTPAVGSNAGGTLIHIEGRGFESDAQVFFNFSGTRIAATHGVVASSKVIAARSPEPSGVGGTVTVEVHSDGRIASLPNGFGYISLPPTISTVNPNTGATAGGTTITITGSGFLPNPTVTIGGVSATGVTRPDPNSITAVTPAGSAGSADVTVLNTDSGTATLPGAFTYTGPPAITLVSPTGGPTIGGTRVTITGSGYQTGATVTFNSVQSPDVLVAATSIICTAPAGPAGTQTVTVTNPDTQSASSSSPSGYTYRATRLFVAHADAPNNRLMVLDYNDGSGLLSNPSGMSSPASSNGAGSPSLATYTDPGLTAGVSDVVYLTNFSSDSVSIFHINATTGAATLQGSPAALTGGTAPRNPVLSRVHVTAAGGQRVLYVLGDNGYISVFAVTAASGALVEVTNSPFRISTIVGTPSPTDWVISGSTLHVADPGRDLIASFTIASDGSLTAVGTPFTAGAGDGPSVLHLFPGGQFLFSSNLGTGGGANAIGVYQLGVSPALTPVTGSPFTAGTGPLGLADDGANLFVANSGSATAQGFAVNTTTGALTASTAQATETAGSPIPSLVQVRSGRLYALNTGTNSIAGFSTATGGGLVALTGSPFAVTGASAVSLWAWGADTVFVLDGAGAQVLPLARNAATGALTIGTAKATLGTVASDLAVSR